MNVLAHELNAALDGTIAGRLLSGLGRRLYFPRGIVAQSAEAKKAAHTANATIGMAYNGGKPLMMSAIADRMPGLTAEETVAYAPTAGIEQARVLWRDLLLQKNPSIKADGISLPVVVPGITAGISYMADLFLDKNLPILVSDPCWDNYGLIFEERREAVLRRIPFFDIPGLAAGKAASGLDMPAIEKAVRGAAKTGTVRLLINFPNNPSGYSPTCSEADALVHLIRETAEGGADVLVICDDAYFGLFYEEDIPGESLFGRLGAIHDKVLAIKVDGPTKEDYAWGFRMGFMTFSSRGLGADQYDGLIKKLMGAIRSSVSCANTPVQYLMPGILADERTAAEKESYYALLRERYRKVKGFIGENPDHPRLKPLPFNSGYFMSFLCLGVDAERLRQELLTKHGIGVIALGNRYLRVAFASVDTEQIPSLYRTIYDTAADL
jgi:aspartate/methionine/tyrosine aminotransferase